MAYTEVKYDALEDKRLSDIKNDEATELTNLETEKTNTIAEADGFYQKQVDAVKDYEATAIENQEKLSELAIDRIEQQKEQAHKDYIKEQAGAYGDWQRQSNAYGVNAEKMAAQGLRNSGYNESSQVRMYTAYQNRVATARAAFEIAKQNYENGIREAELQNNVALAEIRFNSLQQQLQLSLQGFQYKNQLIKDFADRKTQVKQTYFNDWKAVLDQINTQNTLAEQQRQFKAEFDLKEAAQAAANATIGGGGGGNGGGRSIIPTKYTSAADVKATISAAANGNTSNNGENLPEVDMNSVLALGYGPISEAKLASLIKSGEVIRYVEDGKQKFRKAGTNPKNTKNTTTTTTAPRVTAAPTATSKNTAFAPFTTRARS